MRRSRLASQQPVAASSGNPGTAQFHSRTSSANRAESSLSPGQSTALLSLICHPHKKFATR